jgi:hypothetical protein
MFLKRADAYLLVRRKNMKHFLMIALYLLLNSFVTAQVTHRIIFEKKYAELPFGIRIENSGNYSAASFDVVSDSVFFSTFNDSKIYKYFSSELSNQHSLGNREIDFVKGIDENEALKIMQGDEEKSVNPSALYKKLFYGKPRVLKDDGGILSSKDGEIFVKVKVEKNEQLLLETAIPGMSRQTILNFPSNLACADLIGIDAVGNSYLLIETYVTQIPLNVKREVYTLSKSGTFLSVLELPSIKFIYMVKDLQIDAEGNLYHLYSDENGIKIFKWSGLAKSTVSRIIYPLEFLRTFHYNNLKAIEEPLHQKIFGVNTPASRVTALKIGESYALHQYKCSSNNLSPQNITGPDGDIVRTPTWLVVGSNARVAYKWGGFNTLTQYDAGLSSGKYAADINTSGVSSYAVGVDCSGFVSRCWQMSYHSSTSSMPDITTQYATWDELKPGDAIHKIGHVRLFVNRTPNGNFRVVESSARGWDVSYWSYAASDLTSYTPRYYNNMETVANASQPNLLQAIVLPDGNVSLNWNCDTTNIFGYRIYRSVNGETWNLYLDENACKNTAVNISTSNEVEYYRIASVKKIGSDIAESNWSNSMGVRKSATLKCLIVNGFKRNEGSWRGAGHTFAVKYGRALQAVSQNFETVSNSKVLDSIVHLNNYETVFWISGDESTIDETFSHNEQTLIKNYLENGGKLFVSGSEIGWDLSSKGDAADKDFYKNYFKSTFISDGAGSNFVSGVQNSSMSDCQFYFGQTYEEDYPDEINPVGGSTQCLQYVNGKGAGNQYAGIFGTSDKIGKLIYFAFPLETTADDSAFNKVISNSIDFFTSSISSVHGEDQKPTVFYLNQNYPNPFNPNTVINWQLAVGSYVTLKVYDVLGNEVAMLVNEEKSPGSYQVSFNTQQTTNNRQLSSGVYFYQLRAGNFVQIKKMILLK